MDIDAWNITAWDINAYNIEAWDIIAWNIKAINIKVENIFKSTTINARNIRYHAICLAYSSIKCQSIKGRRDNAKNIVLDGEIEMLENGELCEKDLDRLEEYRKIEKELGIDLKVYHKLMNMLYCGEPNILYVKDKDKIVQVGILEINYCKKKIIFYKDKSYNEDYVYGFAQYGETFALTKEELENE